MKQNTIRTIAISLTAFILAILGITAISTMAITPARKQIGTNGHNELVITDAQDNSPYTVNDHVFKAYRIAGYANTNGDIDSNDTLDANGINEYGLHNLVPDDQITKALMDSVTVEDDGHRTVKDDWNGIVGLTDDGELEFLNDDKGLTATQFVASRFYGGGQEHYGRKTANAEEMKTFAESLLEYDKSDAADNSFRDDVMTSEGHDGQVEFRIPDGKDGLYLVTDTGDTGVGKAFSKNDDATGRIARAMIVGTEPSDSSQRNDDDSSDTDDNGLGRITVNDDLTSIRTDVVDDPSNSTENGLVTIGSQRAFRTTVDTPNYLNDHPDAVHDGSIIIHENPSDNLHTDMDDVKVELVPLCTKDDTDASVLDAGKDYTVEPDLTTDDSNDFDIIMGMDGMTSDKYTESRIEVLFDSKVTSILENTTVDSSVGIKDSNNDDGVHTDIDSDEQKLFTAGLELRSTGDWTDDSKDKTMFKVTRTDSKEPVALSTDDGNSYDILSSPSGTGVHSQSDDVISLDDDKDGSFTTIRGLSADTDKPVTYRFTRLHDAPNYPASGNGRNESNGSIDDWFDVKVSPSFSSDSDALDSVSYEITDSSPSVIISAVDGTGKTDDGVIQDEKTVDENTDSTVLTNVVNVSDVSATVNDKLVDADSADSGIMPIADDPTRQCVYAKNVDSSLPNVCWFDMTGFIGTGHGNKYSQNRSVDMGGAVLHYTITYETTPGTSGTRTVSASKIPTWTHAAFGHFGYTNFPDPKEDVTAPGHPALYQSINSSGWQSLGDRTKLTISNMMLTDADGNAVPITDMNIVMGDAESTTKKTGDSAAEKISFHSSTGVSRMASFPNNPTNAQHVTVNGTQYSFCTETSQKTGQLITDYTCTAINDSDYQGIRLYQTKNATDASITLTDASGNSLQGGIFGVYFSSAYTNVNLKAKVKDAIVGKVSSTGLEDVHTDPLQATDTTDTTGSSPALVLLKNDATGRNVVFSLDGDNGKSVNWYAYDISFCSTVSTNTANTCSKDSDFHQVVVENGGISQTVNVKQGQTATGVWRVELRNPIPTFPKTGGYSLIALVSLLTIVVAYKLALARFMSRDNMPAKGRHATMHTVK